MNTHWLVINQKSFTMSVVWLGLSGSIPTKLS